MDEKRIILEEIRRINYISNYKLNETSVENKRHINERYGDGISALRDLAATREGAALLRTEFEAALQSGMELRTIGGAGGSFTKLTKASEILKAIKEERIAMAACKSAVKAHDVLEFPQIYKLLNDLFKCNNPYTCPHGRPTVISIPLYELEKKFKRKV